MVSNEYIDLFLLFTQYIVFVGIIFTIILFIGGNDGR